MGSLEVLVMNPIVVTFFLSVVAAVSEGNSSPYEYEQSYTPEAQQYASEWHSPAPKSYLDSFIGSRQLPSTIDPGLLAALLGTGLSLGTTVLTTNNLEHQVNTVKSTADTAKSKGVATCHMVNSITSIGTPAAQPSTAGTVTAASTNSVTAKIQPSGDTYPINGVTDTSVTPADTAASSGLAKFKAVVATTSGHTTTALSVDTFNTFRKQVADALNTLDAKIRQINALASLTC